MNDETEEQEKTENTNCLEGMKCPRCGSLEPFKIEVTTLIQFTDDGEDLGKGSDQEWDDKSYCECCECIFHGTVKDFKMEEL